MTSPRLGSTGSFDMWSDWVRSALVWLGEADPWKTTETIRADDPKLKAIGEVLSQWQTVIGTDAVTTKCVIDRATERTHDGVSYRFTHDDFRQALLNVAGD